MVPPEMLAAKEHEHRAEIARARMQLVLYRAALEQHGIVPPDRDGEELLALYRRCCAVISTASEFVAEMGTAKEFLTDQSWRRETD